MSNTPSPVAYRWKTTPDSRTRHIPESATDQAWLDIEPPRSLGRFNCRGDYVLDGCVNHPDRPVRVNLDGDDLCQECADAWARAEGHAAMERGNDQGY